MISLLPRRVALSGVLLLSLTTAARKARAQTAGQSSDAVPFAPIEKPSYFWIGWPRNAYYEGEMRIPVYLWSRTAALRPANGRPQDDNSAPCLTGVAAALFAPLRFVIRPARRSGATLDTAGGVGTGCTIQFIRISLFDN